MAENVSLAVRTSKRSVCRQVVPLRYTKCTSIVSVGFVFVTVNMVRFCIPLFDKRLSKTGKTTSEPGVVRPACAMEPKAARPAMAAKAKRLDLMVFFTRGWCGAPPEGGGRSCKIERGEQPV